MKNAKNISVVSAQANVEFACPKCGKNDSLTFSVENGKVKDNTECECGANLKINIKV